MRIAFQLCTIAILSLTGGCHLLTTGDQSQGHSILQPAHAAPGSVAMEVIWARFPAGDAALNESVWQDIDETQIPPAVHRELANNGFRVGVISGSLPDAMSRALHQGEQSEESAAAETDASAQLLQEPSVRRHLLQLRRGRRAEIQASEVYANLPLLVGEGRELGGGTYHDAQAIYALQIEPHADRTVQVQLTPELHYGAARLRWNRGDEGVLHQAPLRDRKVFDQMRMAVQLAPGEMLVLMSLPNAGSRLGHYFHTVDSADGTQQKLILLRLAQVPPSDTFAESTAN